MSDDLYPPASKASIWQSKEHEEIAFSGQVRGSNFVGIATEMLARAAIEGGPPLKTYEMDCYIKRDFLVGMTAMMLEQGARRIFERHTEQGAINKEAWIWATGALFVEYSEPPEEKLLNTEEGEEEDDDNIDFDSQTPIELLMATTNGGLITEMVELKKLHHIEHRYTPKPAGAAYMLCDHPMNGITLTEIGVGGEELIRENYSPEVLTQFDNALDDLKSEKPKGRLIVLDGPPGTGKTYMVRAFMESAPDAKFLIVPPHLVQKLGDPNMIISLLRDNAISGRSIVLVLEDADQCLAVRKAKNMASISSILNLSDGIVGSLLDLRILATTNTPGEEFDKALLRKGRLSAHIRVGELDFVTITNIWHRLAGPKIPNPFAGPNQKSVILADVYAAYNEMPEIERVLGDISKLTQN